MGEGASYESRAGHALRIGLGFCAGFLLCFLLMLAVHSHSTATTGIPTVATAVGKVLSMLNRSEPAHKRAHAPFLYFHLVDADGVDFGQLITTHVPTTYDTNPVPRRSYTVWDTDMECAATYWPGPYGADSMTGSLTLSPLRGVYIASPGASYPTGLVVSFEGTNCSGTPYFDISQGYTTPTSNQPELLLETCTTANDGKRVFKLTATGKTVGIVQSFCHFTGFQPNGLCSDTCQKVNTLNAHPYWTRLVEVTPKKLRLPRHPVRLRPVQFTQ